MKKVVLFCFFIFILCGCTNTIIERPRKTQGIYTPVQKDGEILVGFMMTSDRPDRNIYQIYQKKSLLLKN